MPVHWQRPIPDDDDDFGERMQEMIDAADKTVENLERILTMRRASRLSTKTLPTRHRGEGLDVLTWKRNRRTRWRRMAFVCILPSDIHAH